MLVEKPFAVNAMKQGKSVSGHGSAPCSAWKRMWTRFLPSVRRAKELVDSGVLGELRQVCGSFGSAELVQPGHVVFDPACGGGALLIAALSHFTGSPLRW